MALVSNVVGAIIRAAELHRHAGKRGLACLLDAVVVGIVPDGARNSRRRQLAKVVVRADDAGIQRDLVDVQVARRARIVAGESGILQPTAARLPT